jgi:hypothetical protein
MRTALAALVVLATAAPAVAQPAPVPHDPARVEGTWPYRTYSNCGSVEGVGDVSFRWDAARRAYEERGHVYWADSGLTVRWWGWKTFDGERRALHGTTENSLGDSVTGAWSVEGGAPPARLVVSWSQTNGCRGEGVATRAPP